MPRAGRSTAARPADFAVVQAIQELKARGLRVTFYPFILMDVPADNDLPDPYSDHAAETGQPTFPWRGRITCSPAAGYAGSVDKTAAAGSQVAALFGSAQPSDFAVSGESVSWTGPSGDWGLRRMILHYAHLCAAAGGVDAFLIGSEMRGLTTIRDGAASYPAVAAFRDLLADVRGILGPGTELSYAADWSEYFGHHPADGTGDVFFHLDPLWADADTDFVGIDNYMPLSDWRDGYEHLDAVAGAPARSRSQRWCATSAAAPACPRSASTYPGSGARSRAASSPRSKARAPRSLRSPGTSASMPSRARAPRFQGAAAPTDHRAEGGDAQRSGRRGRARGGFR